MVWYAGVIQLHNVNMTEGRPDEKERDGKMPDEGSILEKNDVHMFID